MLAPKKKTVYSLCSFYRNNDGANMNSKLIAIVGLMLLASACTWVKLTPEGKGVDVRVATSVADCKPIGTLSTSVMDNVSVYKRNEGKVETELVTMARNDAAAEGANVIVPIDRPVEGSQKFKMYNCP